MLAFHRENTVLWGCSKISSHQFQVGNAWLKLPSELELSVVKEGKLLLGQPFRKLQTISLYKKTFRLTIFFAKLNKKNKKVSIYTKQDIITKLWRKQ